MCVCVRTRANVGGVALCICRTGGSVVHVCVCVGVVALVCVYVRWQDESRGGRVVFIFSMSF